MKAAIDAKDEQAGEATGEDNRKISARVWQLTKELKETDGVEFPAERSGVLDVVEKRIGGHLKKRRACAVYLKPWEGGRLLFVLLTVISAMVFWGAVWVWFGYKKHRR
jgi:hypothetical protein